MKANVTLRYRPLSDTVMGFVDELIAESGESTSTPDI